MVLFLKACLISTFAVWGHPTHVCKAIISPDYERSQPQSSQMSLLTALQPFPFSPVSVHTSINPKNSWRLCYRLHFSTKPNLPCLYCPPCIFSSLPTVIHSSIPPQTVLLFVGFFLVVGSHTLRHRLPWTSLLCIDDIRAACSTAGPQPGPVG